VTARRIRRQDESGFNLIELAVTVLIFGIVSVALLNFLDNTTTISARATASSVRENEGRQALRTVTQELRAANKIVSNAATVPAGAGMANVCPAPTAFPGSFANCVVFEVQRSTDATIACPKSLVLIGLTTGSLMFTRIDYASNCTTEVRRSGGRLASRVVNGPGTPLFQYYNASGALLTTAAGADAYVKASSVRVNLVLEYKTGASPLRLNSVVALRNNR
jgi:prepilin-type N-terminal cleavage/methylation domain-containing protein